MTDDYLACTKAPPRDVPKAMGLGLCGAPRNHDGPCQYEWMGGLATLEVHRGPSPMDRARDIERLYYSTRRAYRVAVVATFVTVAASVFQILNLIGAALP